MVKILFRKKLRVDACYHSSQHLLSSSLLTKNIKIEIKRTISFSVVLYGCETYLFIEGGNKAEVSEENIRA
jgi:hypothetical protein